MKYLKLLARYKKTSRILNALKQHLKEKMHDSVDQYKPDSLLGSAELIAEIRVYEEVLQFINKKENE